jgi:hypothetical protein
MMEEEEEAPRQEALEQERPASEAPVAEDVGPLVDDLGLLTQVHDLLIRAPKTGSPGALDNFKDEELVQALGRRLCEVNGGVWEPNPHGEDALWDADYVKDSHKVHIRVLPTNRAYPFPGSEAFEQMSYLIIVSRDSGEVRSREKLVEMIGMPAALHIVLPHEFFGFIEPALAADISVNQYSLGDHPIARVADDKLDFADYAVALANLVDNPATETPLTLAVHAAWGVGKSSLGKMIQDRLGDKPAARPRGMEWQPMAPHRIFWFNAWRHDEADSLVTAFVAELARDCFRHSSLLSRMCRPLPKAMRTRSMAVWANAWQLFLFLLGTVVVCIMLYLLLRSQNFTGLWTWLEIDLTKSQDVIKLITGSSVVAGLLKLINWALSVRSSIEQFVADPKEAAAKGLIGDTREYLAALVRRSIPEGSRLIIFIDDIERCRGSGGVDLLEAINQLLMQHEAGQSSLPIVVIVLGDIDLVALAAGNKYKDIAEYSAFIDPISGLAASLSPEDAKKAAIYHHGRRHLQKIVQLRFNLIPADRNAVAVLSRRPDEAPKSTPAPVSAGKQLGREFMRMLKQLEPLGAAVEGQSVSATLREHRTLLTFHQTRRELSGVRRAIVSFFGAYGYVLLRIVAIICAPAYLMAYLAAELAYPRMARTRGLKHGLRQLLTVGGGLLAIGLITLYFGIYLVFVYIDPTLYTDSLGPLQELFGTYDTPWITLLLAAAMLIVFGFFSFWSGYSALRRKDQQRLERYAAGDRSLDEAERASVVYQRIQEAQADLAVTNESEFFRDAQARVLTDLSLTPRMLKRCANRVRLMMSILDQRKLLGTHATGKPDRDNLNASRPQIGVSADALGKWVAFEEMWPDLARSAMKDPSLLVAWEGMARGVAQTTPNSETLIAADKDGVSTFLKRDPDLSRLVDQLLGLREPPRPSAG